MFDTEVRPRIEAAVGAGDGAASAVLGVAGLPESVLQERILALTPAREAPEEISILPSEERSRSGSLPRRSGPPRFPGSPTPSPRASARRSSPGRRENGSNTPWAACCGRGASAPPSPNR